MGEHTKGPWEAVPARGYEKRGWVEVVAHRNRPVVVVDAFERHSCDESECPECHHGVRITPEDARLIAAAPELLDALERVTKAFFKLVPTRCLGCGKDYTSPESRRNAEEWQCPCGGLLQEAKEQAGAIETARAAIAKARGTR